MLVRLNATLRRVPRWAIILGSAAYTAMVAALEASMPLRVELAVFYLPPIAALAWYLGRRTAVLFGVLVALLGVAVAFGSGQPTELAIWNALTHLLFFLLVAALVAVLAEQTVQLRALAREDPLTGIPNRRAFFGALDRALEWSRRQGSPWVLAYLDVDNFKKVNDTLGHSTGDALLRRTARVLREGTRRIDVVARLGGDEFALLLPKTDAESAERIVGKLLVQLDEAMAAAGWGQVSFSAGVVTFTAPPESVDVAVAMADACMYRVKARGKAGALFRSWPREAALEMPRSVRPDVRAAGRTG
jgi:diguanylate cyclase (GGDEF)-like protein